MAYDDKPKAQFQNVLINNSQISQPETIHQRTPLIVGSQVEMERLFELFKTQVS